MNYTKAEFLTSAAQLTQLPPDLGAEVAFAGRSNVGKSSALNTLTKQRNLARTSKTPGRTQLINFFTLDETHRLVDLPGYGYAKVSEEIKERWQHTLSQYLQSRACLRGIILLMDIRHPLREFDQMMLAWSNHQQIPVHILLTKADKFGFGAAMKTYHQVKKEIAQYYSISVQLFSSLKKTGIEELTQKLDEWLI